MPGQLNVRLLCCALMLAGTSVWAQSTYTFHKRAITQAEGLPDRNVNCGIQDRFGYLWFGTRSGLCVYDGNQFKSLTKKSHGLRGVSVLELAADDSVGIIIRYNESGSSIGVNQIVDVVNIKTREVRSFSSYYPDAPFKESDIDQILYTRGKPLQFTLKPATGFTWTYSHLSGFKKVPIKRTPIVAKIESSEKISQEQIRDLHAKFNRNIILAADSSLILTKPNNNILHVRNKGYVIAYHDSVLPKNLVYFLDFNGNLFLPDSLQKMQQKITGDRVYLWGPNYSHWNLYISPHNDSEDAVIEMYTREIMFYSPLTGFTKIFEQNENVKVKAFFKDKLGAWWLCTNVGLYKLTFKKNLFERNFVRDQTKFSFNNSARGIYVDDDVSCFNLYDHPVIIIRGDTLMPDIEQNFAAERVGDALWIGQYSLFKVDLNNKRISEMASSGLAEIWSIFPISNEEFFIGCTRGLARYNVSENKITPVGTAPYPPAKFVYRIFRNQAGQIMAVAENGVYFMDEGGNISDYFSIDATRAENKLPCSGIQDVHQDNDGTYWIASSLEGFFRWDMKDHTFQQFSIENGLLSTVICCVREDGQNNLWLSTDYGLSCFNKTTGKAVSYTTKDGLSDNEFNRGSSFKDAKGRLYFGGMNGVTSFDPRDFEETLPEKKYDLLINSAHYINSRTGAFEDKTWQVLEERSITLNEETKSFALRFVLLDYENKQHRYAYKLEGLENDWHITNDDQIQLGNLPYSNYRLRVKAQLVNGNWSDQEISIAVSVPAPFYKRWWFLTLMGLLLVMLITAILGYRTHRLKNRNSQLEQIVSDRTRELQLSLNEQKAMLQEIHHRVKNNLQFIEAIINMQINMANEESSQILLQDINRRINAMTLVHEMLYNKESLEKISVRHYVAELIKKLRGIVEVKQSNFEFNDEIDDIQLDINTCMALGMITTELVSNSLKHGAVDSQNPSISIQLKKTNKEKNYFYKIRDNGPGLPEGKLQSGLGMRLIDIFARQLRGSYTFRNDDGLLFTLEMTLVVDQGPVF